MRNREDKKKKSPLHPASAVIIGLGVFGGAVHAGCLFSESFAEGINNTLGAFLRFFLAKIFNILPFSFMEFLLLSSPVLIFFTVYLARKCAKRGGVYIIRALSAVLSVALGVYFCFSVGFAPGYRARPLAEKLNLTQRDVSAQELYTVTEVVIGELNVLCENTSYENDGSSHMPFTLSQLSRELSLCYEDMSNDYGFPATFSSNVKPIILSPYMTYTHISGIYSFFTGEANLNTNYPDFVNVYTAAHEMAHQRGIAREDEANFTAFLVCSRSENEYIRYSAYLNMYEYLANALYSADPDLYAKAYHSLAQSAKSELSAYSRFFDKYRNSTASQVSDTLNNAYLESQGTEGTKSYGMVVDLAVAYYLD